MSDYDTIEKVRDLSVVELRTVVATLCGWTNIKYDHWGRDWAFWNGIKEGMRENVELPDYPDDLNAMHEAESTMSTEMSNSYWGTLLGIVNDRDYPTGDVKRHYAHATARQRAEAFVLASNASSVLRQLDRDARSPAASQ